MSPRQLTQHETLFAGPWGPAERPCGVNLGLVVLFCLCLSPPARISLSFLSLSFLSLSLGLSIFLLPGNNCLCFPACCRWRQPSLNSSWHPWLRMSQKGWEHGKCRSLALGSGRAQPGSGLFDRLAPCLLKAPGKEGRRFWETLVRRMWAFSFKHRFKF